jgi:hypothetical protein
MDIHGSELFCKCEIGLMSELKTFDDPIDQAHDKSKAS